jgi:dihydropteroate synthase type 2
MTRIIAILNITRDSFSDGGRYLEPEAALEHARQLVADGADIIDIGAESTHPDAEDVPAQIEIDRLTPVIEQLKADGVRVSVDTYKPAVMRHVLALGVDLINDVTALRDPEAVAAVRDSAARLIIMHSRASAGRAERVAPAWGVTPASSRCNSDTVVDEIVAFFQRRVGELTAAGIDRRRLILDSGMGFFLSPRAEDSLAVLRELERIAALGLPVCVSTSRKSFIGSVLGGEGTPRPVSQRAAGTLATEIWAAWHGAAYIRTHDVRALRDALSMLTAIERGAPLSPKAGD